MIIIPTAINLVTAINESIRLAWMRNQDAQILLPSLFDRAKMVYNETGVLPVQTITPPSSGNFTK